MSTRNMAVLSDVTNFPNLVQWQPADGSRLASGFLVGTDAIILFLITRAGKKKLLLHTVRGRSQLSTFMKAYTAYARRRGPGTTIRFPPENQHFF